MIRFMGFVTGAAVAIGLMLFLFGLPELPEPTETATPEPPPAELAEPALAAASPPAAVAEASIPEPTPEPTPPEPETTPEPEADPTPVPVAAAPAEPQPVEEPEEIDELEAAADDTVETLPPDFAIAVGNEPLAADLKWHAFWSPFRSRIAADGFIGRLEAVTGFDYRVVKMDSGVYEVAFAYANDEERMSKLEAIEVATGLEMPES